MSTLILKSRFVPYERRLDRDREWALDEGGRYFQADSEAHKALRAVTRRLNDLEIPYAVVGGLALYAYGYRRFTDDVDLLVTSEGLKQIHDRLEGRGYLPPFNGSKQLRDTEYGVKIEFLITGNYPGDGKEKPVAFPDPSSVAVKLGEINYLGLPTLVELKLASGMSAPHRMKDLTDVMELIRVIALPRGLSSELNPYVRAKYDELWKVVNGAPKRFVSIWRNKLLTVNCKSLAEMIAVLRAAADNLDAMKADGVRLDPEGGTGDDYALLFTDDAGVAEKYGFEDEESYWGDEPEFVDGGHDAPATPKP